MNGQPYPLSAEVPLLTFDKSQAIEPIGRRMALANQSVKCGIIARNFTRSYRGKQIQITLRKRLWGGMGGIMITKAMKFAVYAALIFGAAGSLGATHWLIMPMPAMPPRAARPPPALPIGLMPSGDAAPVRSAVPGAMTDSPYPEGCGEPI